MKWYQWLFCIIMIFCGSYCAIDGYKMITATSITVGDYKYVSYLTEDLFSNNCVDIAFGEPINGVYFWKKSFEKVDFNGSVNDYILLVNDCPTYDQITTSGAITSNFVLDFLDTDGVISGSFYIKIEIKFLITGVGLTISLSDVSDNLDNFLLYVDNEGLVIKVVKAV